MWCSRSVIFLVLILTIFALTGEAQNRLNFPRVLSSQELSTTGLAFVNTSSFTVGATFTFYKTDGTLVGQSTLDVPAKGQVAKLASEILPAANSDVWIQVSSSNPELQGFEIVGNFATLVDGAGPAAEGTQLAVIDFSREDIIYVANPGSQAASVQLKLNAADGSTLMTKSVTLSGFQATAFRLGDLNNDDNIDAVLITSNVSVSSSLMTKLPGGADIGLTNAIATSTAPSSLFFPFAPAGQQGGSTWKTFLGITNVGTSSQTISITFNGEGGAPTTIQRNLAVGASIGDSVATLFSLPVSAFTAGWLRVSGSGPLVGTAAYQDSATGALAIVPSQSAGSTRFFFGHIASLTPWYTGIALLNTSGTAANVEIYAISGGGEALGSVSTFSVPANSRRTSLLSEFVPKVLERTSDGGWVFVRSTNNVPLLGFELFGSAIFPILANVQGFALPPASTFIPPTVTSIGGVSLDAVSVTDGIISKSSFKPGDPIVYVATIRNTSGATGRVPLTIAVTDPLGGTMLTSTTTVTIPATATDITYSSQIPSNALSGQYLATFSMTYQDQTALRSARMDVTNGTTTPSADQDTPLSMTFNGVPALAFRPGDPVRFSIPMANFTNQSVTATLNYQFTGPGSSSAGSGALNITIPTGISTQNIDTLTIPSSAQQGLFVLTSTLTVSGKTSTKGIALTVVPKTSAEAINVENVFVTDSGGVPRSGFTPGSAVVLNIWRMSTIPVSTPGTARYTVTGPSGSSVLDQPLSAAFPTGNSVGQVTLALIPNGELGNFTFDGTITYSDAGTKTSTMSTAFAVSATPPALKETLSAMHPHVRDINLVTRTAFSPGESILFFRAVYSTFAAPLGGTVRYQLYTPEGLLILDAPVSTAFNPGMNVSFAGVTTTTAIPTGKYSLTIIASAGGQSSSSSVSFAIAGPATPNTNFSVVPTQQTTSAQSILVGDKLIESPVAVREYSVNDAEESLKER